MIVTWIAIQSQPLPWVEQRTDVAYVACGERAGELSLIRKADSEASPAIDRLLHSIEKAIAVEKGKETSVPNLSWLRKAMPDQGTSIRLSSPRQCKAVSYEEQIERLTKG